MKVIDLLNKIANGEEVPKKVKVLDMSLLPEYQTITWNEDLKLYEYCDGCEFDRVLDKHHLSNYIKIIEDTPKEDKKIEELSTWFAVSDTSYTLDGICKFIDHNTEMFYDKINELVRKVNGEDNDN